MNAYDKSRLARSRNLDELLVTALRMAEAEGRSTYTFEQMVEAAYTAFPERFSLWGFPQWPDSVVVNKSWLRARSDRHWLAGLGAGGIPA
jgi:hypothetical protein